MIALVHTIWHAIAELLLPSWQKDVRDITYQVVKAMKEAKKMKLLFDCHSFICIVKNSFPFRSKSYAAVLRR